MSRKQAPAYSEAIEATLAAIERRIRLYRSLVIGVLVIALGSAILALVFGSPVILVCAFVAVPATGVYLLADHRAVARWRDGILALWQKDELDLPVFLSTMTAHPYPPARTLAGMLASLPTRTQDQPVDKAALLRALQRASRVEGYRILLATAGLSLAALVLAMCLWRFRAR